MTTNGGQAHARIPQRQHAPPSYRQLYPEGRDRLLALAEPSSAINNNVYSSSASVLAPRMGLKTNRPPVAPRPLLRPTPIYASEQSLPDKLTQALRGLSSSFKPTGGLVAGSGIQGQFKQSGTVAADDVIYYPSVEPRKRKEEFDKLLRAAENGTFQQQQQADCAFEMNDQPPPRVSSLEQLRQLYKSAPDFGELADGYGEETSIPAQHRYSGVESSATPLIANHRYFGQKDDSFRYAISTDNDRPKPHPRFNGVAHAPTATGSSSSNSAKIPPSAVFPHHHYANIAELGLLQQHATTRTTSGASGVSQAAHRRSFPVHDGNSQRFGAPKVNTTVNTVLMDETAGGSPTDSGYRSVPRYVHQEQNNGVVLQNAASKGGTIVVIDDEDGDGSGGGTATSSKSDAGGQRRRVTAAFGSSELSSPAGEYASSSRSCSGASAPADDTSQTATSSAATATAVGKSAADLHVIPEKDDADANVSRFVNGKVEKKSSKGKRHTGSQMRFDGSIETLNTTVSLPEELSLDRCPKLVELDRVPWTEKSVIAVLQRGRTKDLVHRIGVDVVPRLTYLLQRPLVRLSREVQRLATQFGKCTKKDVKTAVKIVLPSGLSESCLTAGIQACSLYAMGGFEGLRQSKSRRAGLRFSVGRFHRWLCDAQIAACVDEHASVFLCAVMECILEELVLHCIPGGRCSSIEDRSVILHEKSGSFEDVMLTSDSLDLALVANTDFWGLLQPYQHLISSRTANGMLCLPNSFGQMPSKSHSRVHQSVENGGRGTKTNGSINSNLEQCLLATCVGKIAELSDLISRILEQHKTDSVSTIGSPSVIGSQLSLLIGVGSDKLTASSKRRQATTFEWGGDAVASLFHFMRCSQLAHGCAMNGQPTAAPLALSHERPYLALPPLVDWMRVSAAFCEHSQNGCTINAEHVRQASRVLLPGIDCPSPSFIWDTSFNCNRQMSSSRMLATAALNTKFRQSLAFELLATGRGDMVPSAIALLGPLKLNTTNDQGLTPLMLAVLRSDPTSVHLLLDAGADVNTPVPLSSHPDRCPHLLSELSGWTSLSFAVSRRDLPLCHLLIDRCADVESPEMVTETPLQLAAMTGHFDIARRLLAVGSDPFLATIKEDDGHYGFRQRGAPSALALAAASGHTQLVQLMLHKAQRGKVEEVLTLEDFLAEASDGSPRRQNIGRVANEWGSSSPNSTNKGPTDWSKQQQKALQECMYHAAESFHLDIVIELRNLGIPWNLHIWTQSLAAAHDLRRRSLVQTLLDDFLQPTSIRPTKNSTAIVGAAARLADEVTTEFIDDGLPLLFDIFRHSKNDITTRCLVEIFADLYGQEEPIPRVKLDPQYSAIQTAGIDPKFVNSPELSDIVFSIEGRKFYGHRIVLVNASPVFKQLLLGQQQNSEQPSIDIDNISYKVFELLMDYLYRGKLKEVKQTDVSKLLQLLSAAQHFEIRSLTQRCEVLLAQSVDRSNCVDIYKFAAAENASGLMAYCEGFFLQNLSSLVVSIETTSPSPVGSAFCRMLANSGKSPKHVDLCAGLIGTLSSRLHAKLDAKR